MKTILILALVVPFLPSCTVLSALGIGAQDLAPSLKYCERVEYKRVETKAEIRAQCTVPAG